MDEAQSITIFHLRRPGGHSEILHPFGREVPLAENSLPVTGLFGADPEMDAVNQFRELLYRQIDSEIRSWLTEMRFIPRFVATAVVFLLVYFILSLAIRDPIPLVVQLGGATAVSVALFHWMGRRGELSSIAVEKRAGLRRQVDAISFAYSPVLEAVEDLLELYQTQTDLSLAGLLAELRRLAADEREGICPALAAAVAARHDEATLHKLARRFGPPHDDVPFEALVQWAKAFRADAGLLAVCLAFKS
jgi:hypothetical protein